MSDVDLAHEFEQWIHRPGAPQVRIHSARSRKTEKGYSLEAVVEQAQPGQSFKLRLPLAITLDGRKQAYQAVIDMDGPKTEISLTRRGGRSGSMRTLNLTSSAGWTGTKSPRPSRRPWAPGKCSSSFHLVRKRR
ncbi:MAG: hypothetical protein MZV70_59400 [Desulfobacterales bacterium]|nr:hypothetical protein [Desulfobacterales bacterium]